MELTDPWARLGVGGAVLLATAGAARPDRVGSWEASTFQAVNGLPDALFPPAWVVMQIGRLRCRARGRGYGVARRRPRAGGSSPGRRHWRLGVVEAGQAGSAPPRPVALLPGTRGRGRDATGLGYLSGHAAVAVALGATALPRLGPAGRALTLTAIPLVGLTRVYVGAHLPLDIAGGAALGLAVDAAQALVTSRVRTQPGRCAPRGAEGRRRPLKSVRVSGIPRMPPARPPAFLISGGGHL